jgi:hypothetical protein
MPDADWRGMLATIGVVKGQPFNPDARTRAILDKAAQTAWKMGKVVAYTGAATWEGGLRYPDRHWIDPNLDLRLDVEWMRTAGNYTDMDGRIGMFAQAYSFSPAMVSRTVGKGAQYMAAYQDSDGEFLRGGNNYRLHLPPKIPAGNFWSITISDSAQGSGLDNGQPFPSIGSRDKPVVNADGSVELYYGPTAPAGKEKNWQRTVPGKGWFAMFRLYGPTEAAIDKSWKPTDFVKVK